MIRYLRFLQFSLIGFVTFAFVLMIFLLGFRLGLGYSYPLVQLDLLRSASSSIPAADSSSGGPVSILVEDND